MEAGQSAFGDSVCLVRKQILSWPLKNTLAIIDGLGDDIIQHATNEIIPQLSRMAAEIPIDEHLELSTDWFNGRRTPDAKRPGKGCYYRPSLGAGANPSIFRSLVESTCFGAKATLQKGS